jgi:lipopolysaccharide export LptBFGC system permease protein LptF
MELTERELWAIVHGLGLGTLFLLAFAGGLAGIWSLREKYLTAEGMQERSPRLVLGTTIMAVVAWLTVITGTFIVYPWYRAKPPEGVSLTDQAGLAAYPRYWLLAGDSTKEWHNFGMEWKEHVAWMAPFLATAVAFAVAYYGMQLIRRGDVRRAVLIFFTLAFLAAGVAGLFGAFITKAAPVA